MARQRAPIEVNTFVQGLVTEATPLTFPENASLDEDNFELLRNGSRQRRLGMDLEEDAEVVTTAMYQEGGERISYSSFNWQNAGGVPDKELLVIQIGNSIEIFDTDSIPLSQGRIYSEFIPSGNAFITYSFDSVDGVLVVACGQDELYSFEYEEGNITRRSFRLLIRDFFGVEDIVGGSNLREGDDVSRRVADLPNQHRYNLRNQSWATPRNIGARGAVESDQSLIDPIVAFREVAGVHPSNADSVIQSLYANPSDEENRTGDQFFPDDLRDNPIGSTLTANGHFIIDALSRGASRLNSIQRIHDQNPNLDYYFDTLPLDRTPGGAACLSQFAGRMWYAGFSGDVIDGDSLSPKMSSYLLYSRLVQTPNDLNKCYQEGDPTSKDAPDLLDTDGGFIRIDGAYRIQKMITLGASLMIVAQNGIWMVGGGSDYGFTANNVKITKVTDKGCDSIGSVVEVDSSVMLWADDAIYHIHQNEYGDWVSSNLSRTTIQTFYERIPPVSKFYAKGLYDSYEGKVRWIYDNDPNNLSPSRELVFDTILGAFYTNTIYVPNEASTPKVITPIRLPAFRTTSELQDVLVAGTPVTVNGEVVTASVPVRGSSFQETQYLTLTQTYPVHYTFSLYRDQEFLDFKSIDGVGVDAEAYLITGWMSGGDFQRLKSVPYIQFYFNRTETGFEQDATGNLFPLRESSCIVQAQWNWTNSPNANRWGREFEAYRYRRLYSPSGVTDPFDSGDAVIQTKNKLRGSGKVLSIYARTSPGKDCQLLGWSMIIGVNGNV